MKSKDDIASIFSSKRLLFLLLFMILVFVGNKINFSYIVGTNNQYFTLFQFFSPIAGAFLGPIYGVIAVLCSGLLDFILVGKAWSIINLLRLTPMLFAAYYIGTDKRAVSILIPILGMFMFILHPVGNIAWLYSLFWLIPIIVKVLPIRYAEHKLLKSLGATFTAHCVGSIIFIYTIPTEPGMWVGLIPTVIMERTLFGLGIYISYLVVNWIVASAIDKWKLDIPSDILKLNSRGFVSK